jgi:hypothetical protein
VSRMCCPACLCRSRRSPDVIGPYRGDVSREAPRHRCGPRGQPRDTGTTDGGGGDCVGWQHATV